MAYENMMDDDQSSPSQAEGGIGNSEEKSDETEDQLALVPMSFFQNKDEPIKPGMRETVEVVHVYENEVSIKCIYEEKKEEESEAMPEAEAAPAEAEDSMMT